MLNLKISLFVFLLVVFDFSFVTAKPRWNAQRRSAPGPEILDTNAKRFAAGLPPLPPAKRWMPTSTGSSPKPSTSLFPISGVIKVSNDKHDLLGYLSKDLQNGHFVLTQHLSDADKFSTSVQSFGKTSRISLLDTNSKDGLYLAGIIDQGVYLSPNSATFAILGDSKKTMPGAPPQSGTSPTIPGLSETSIWTFDQYSHCLDPQWINPDYSTPYTVILYDWKAQEFLLTGSPDYVRSIRHDAWPVKFSLY
jgi:hypothetical protein